jgi:ATP-dependent RNA helicase DHX29
LVAHLQSDFAAALLKNVPKRRREEGLAPLKLVLMSATINADLFSSYLGGCPVVYAAGRAYSVDTHFLEDVLEKLQYVLPADHPAALESEGQDNSVVNDIAKSNQEARQLAEAWGCSSHDNVFGTVTGPNPNFKYVPII